MNKQSPPTYTELVSALVLAENWVKEHRYQMSGYQIADDIGVDLKKIRGILDRVHEFAPEMLDSN